MLMVHRIAQGWLMNTDKMQGPGLFVKYKHTPDPPPPNNLDTGLELLTQGQACELDMANFLQRFVWGLWQWQND